jgi:hypothetical protein
MSARPKDTGRHGAALFATRVPVLEQLAKRILTAGWRAPLLDGQLKTALERAAYERLLHDKDGFPKGLELRELRYGHESCEHLLPTPAMWRKAGKLAKRLGLGFSVTLPPTYASREPELLAALETLDALASELGEAIEVSAADWGTVLFIQERAGLRPSLGRVMNRMKRFERWSQARPSARLVGLQEASAEGVAPNGDRVLGAQVAMLQRSPFDSEAIRALGDDAGVARHEYDPVPQGIAGLSPEGARLPTALHAPWTYVTQGRRCVTRELIEGQDVRHAASCKAPCLGRLVLSDYREEKNGPVTLDALVQKGNAVYMENTRFLRRVAPALRADTLWIIRPVL